MLGSNFLNEFAYRKQILLSLIVKHQLSSINTMTGEKQGKKQEDPKPAGPQDADTKAKEKKPAGRPKSSAAPSKRKAEAPSASAPSKAARRSSRTIPTTARSAVDILKLLLSPDSLALTRPKDEASSLSENDAKVRTYSESEFTAFEELMSAVILSRPISHVLGVRSIRTVLNPPYEFSTPEKLKEAGVEGVRKALDVAKTQHRQKTAEELVGLAEAVMGAIAKGKGSWEEAVRGKSKEDFDEVMCMHETLYTVANNDRHEICYPRTSKA